MLRVEAGSLVAFVEYAQAACSVEAKEENGSGRRIDDLCSRRRAVQPRDEWLNKLIWGDNKLIAPSLLEDFAGQSASFHRTSWNALGDPDL
jgi:hypothetical protein